MKPSIRLASLFCSGGLSLVSGGYGDLPSAFEPNRGQADHKYHYVVRSAGYSVSLGPDEAAMAVRDASVRMKFVNQGKPTIEPMEALPGKSNYYMGQDRSQWLHDIPQYAKVRYRNLWPGIDLVFYGKRGRNEYDFVVHPEADPGQIAFALEGPRKLRVDKDGNLILGVKGGQLTHLRPVIYQEKAGKREPVRGRYRVTGRTVRFELAQYDRKRTLVIDPVLTYSTFLGGASSDQAYGVAVDSAGNAYVAGETGSSAFPTQAAAQGTIGGYGDAFVTKLNAQGTALLYSTFLGGSGGEHASAIAIDAQGNAYVTGYASAGFPTTVGAYQRTVGAALTYDAFVVKLSSTGTLTYSTLIGGTADDVGKGIAVDASGNAYIAGTTSSGNFPTTSGAYDVTYPNSSSGFVAKLNPTGAALVYSSYLDYGDPRAIALSAAGEAFVAGSAASGYPTTIGAYRINCGPGFVTRMASSGNAVVYSTCMPYGIAGIAVDAAGNAYTASSGDYSYYYGGWVYKLNATGTSTLLQVQPDPGQSSTLTSVALDSSGNILVGGQLANRAAVIRLTPAGVIASYQFFAPDTSSVNAVAVDSTGAVYAAGWASTAQFVTTAGAYDTTFSGYYDAFVAKLDISDTLTATVTVDTRPQGLSISVDGTAGNSPRTFNWTPSQPHAIAVATPQAGPAGTRYRFANWSTYASGTDITFTPTISGSNQLIAYFQPQYQVVLTSNPLAGGILSSSYLAGGWTDAADISVSATPNPGFRLSSWGGDYAKTYDGGGYANFRVDRPGSIIGNFVTCLVSPPPAIVLGPDSSYTYFSINADVGCSWTMTVPSGWIYSGSQNGVGPARPSFSYSYLSTPTPRTLTLQLSGGSNVPVVQKQPTAAWRNAAGGLVVGTRNTNIAPTLPAGFVSDAAATQTFGGDTIVVARDGYNGLYALRFDATNQVWASAWFLGGSAIGTPAITMAASGTAVMAIRDSWNSYWLRTIDVANGSGTWTHLGGVLSTDPAIAAGPGNSIYVVGKDNWNGIWSNRYVMGTGPQGWRFGGGIIKGVPSIAVGTDDIAYLSVRDTSDAVWMGRVQQETWLPWIWAGGVVAADPQIAANGTNITMASTDGTGNIYALTWSSNSSSFSNWYGQWAALQDFSLCGVGNNTFVVGRVRGTGVVEWYGVDGYAHYYNSGVSAARPVSCGPR